MLQRFFAVTLFALVIAGCGGPAKLTEAQKQTFGDTVSSIGRAATAAKRAKGLQSSVPSALRANVPHADPTDLMAEKLQGARCEVTQPTISSAGSNMSVGGAGCPIALSLSSSFDGTGSSTFKMSYSVNDPDFKQLNDVTAFSFEGAIKVSGQSGSIAGIGSITSNQYGNISWNLRGSLEAGSNSASGSYSMTFNYPDFTVELKQEITADANGSKTTTYLNGEELSPEETHKLFSRVGDLLPGRSTAR